MKIGVFGDSFAEKRSDAGKIWWSILSNRYNHTIESFGESASSISFSAKKILQKKDNYDLVIWCTSQIGRMTLEYPDQTYHLQMSKTLESFQNENIKKKFQIFQQYWLELMDWENEKFINRCVIEFTKDHCQNLQIIPGFYDPTESFFNLHNVSSNEIKNFFNGQIPDNFYTDYKDERIGHLTQTSHEILADILSNNLTPGVFETEYSYFPKYDNPTFIKKIK